MLFVCHRTYTPSFRYFLNTKLIKAIYTNEHKLNAIPNTEITIFIFNANPMSIKIVEQASTLILILTLRSSNRSPITGVPRLPACLPYLYVHHKKGTIFEA